MEYNAIFHLILHHREHNGVEAYTANDNQTAYFAVSNMGFNFFSTNLSEKGAKVVPAFDAIGNGIGNGTITAIDIKTGNIKWVYPTKIISHTMKLDEAPKGYELFDKKEDVTKVVFKP